MFRAFEYGRYACGFKEPVVDDDCLSVERAADLCVGRVNLCGWRGGSVAARRLGVIDEASQTQDLAETADPAQNVVLVPAFTGLGAPYWKPDCRGAIYGLTRNSGPNELARAALESVGFQTYDLLKAMQADWSSQEGQAILRVDGGMSASDWTMQFLSDIIGAPVGPAGNS